MLDSEPPGLSIREQQVFQLVREGRVDSEIAVRLGLGTGEVKQTVTVLVSKCGVPDRAGLLRWSPGRSTAPRRGRADAFADRLGANATGLALMAIVLAAFVIVIWRAWSGDGEPTDLSGIFTPTSSGSPSITPTR